MYIRTRLIALVIFLVLINLNQAIVDMTYFRYLGLQISASPEQIQKAYQEKKLKIQAQQNPEQKARKSKLLQTAYRTLITQNQRQKYERYGKDYVKNNIQQITSINQYTGHDSRKGATLNLKIPISIEDLFNGTTVKAVFETKEACTKCMGTGAESSKNLQNCNVCGSRGFSIINGRNMYGQPQKFEGICPHCQGSGKIVTKHCPVCHGKKILDKVKTIEVEIPAKFQGKEIKLRNYGPEQQLGAPSDILVQIEEIPSEHWRRNGDNLFYTMQISLEQSIFGFSRPIRHLSGEQILIERSEVTTKQTKLSFPQKGFTEKGKLTVEFKINIPNFTDRQLDMWEDFFNKYKL